MEFRICELRIAIANCELIVTLGIANRKSLNQSSRVAQGSLTSRSPGRKPLAIPNRNSSPQFDIRVAVIF